MTGERRGHHSFGNEGAEESPYCLLHSSSFEESVPALQVAVCWGLVQYRSGEAQVAHCRLWSGLLHG